MHKYSIKIGKYYINLLNTDKIWYNRNLKKQKGDLKKWESQKRNLNRIRIKLKKGEIQKKED